MARLTVEEAFLALATIAIDVRKENKELKSILQSTLVELQKLQNAFNELKASQTNFSNVFIEDSRLVQLLTDAEIPVTPVEDETSTVVQPAIL